MADDKDKGKEGAGQQQPGAGSQQPPDLSSNPSTIDAPARTGGAVSGSTTTDQREAKTNLQPLGSRPPGDRAEAEVQAAVEDAMHKEYVQQEAQRRVAAERAKQLMDNVNTDNPYNLEPGQKPVYRVGAFLVDPDGTRIEKVSQQPRAQAQEIIVDRATRMKQM